MHGMHKHKHMPYAAVTWRNRKSFYTIVPRDVVTATVGVIATALSTNSIQSAGL